MNTQSLKDQGQCAKHVSLCTKLWCVTPWKWVTKRKRKRKGRGYFVEGYQMLSICKSLSRFMELAVLLISRNSFTFLLVRYGSFLIICVSSCRSWWSFFIIFFAMPFLITPLTTARLCSCSLVWRLRLCFTYIYIHSTTLTQKVVLVRYMYIALFISSLSWCPTS